MGSTPAGIDHVNIFVRDWKRSHAWYTDIFGFHTQDVMDNERVRGVFLSCEPGHAHDIALFEVGPDAPGVQPRQVGLNHVAWRMRSLEDLAEMYHRLEAKGVPFRVGDHAVSIGLYFSDPDGNGLEAYYELPRSEWGRERPFSEGGGKGRFRGPWDEALRS